MVRFVGADALHVVLGTPSDLYDQLASGAIDLDAVEGVVVLSDTQGVQLWTVAELDDAHSLAEILRHPPAVVVAAGAEPDEPAVVVERGTVTGAFLPARSRRRGLTAMAPAMAADERLEAPAADRPFRATPHLDAPATIATDPGTSFAVEVYTDARPFAAGEEGEGLAVEAPPGVDHVDVHVFLVVTEHFEVEGDGHGELRLGRDVPDSDRVPFTVTVAAGAPDRRAGIQAVFLHKGRTCGHVGRAWDWHAPEATAAAAQPAAAVSLPVHADAAEPDLSVYVVAPIADGTHYQCAVETRLIPGYATATWTPWGLNPDRHAYVTRLLNAIVDEDRSDKERLRAISEAGYEVWEAAPPVFKEVLWALVDAGQRPKGIYIASAEPSLPWELMIPTRQDGKQPDELEPLGVEFAIGRWTRGDAASPPPGIPVATACVVAPRYTGARALDASGEIDFLAERLNGQLVSPATIDHIDEWLADHPASLLHFVCHGAADVDDDDALYLDTEEVLRSRTLRTMRGVKAMCKQHRPIVFVNACDTGRLTPSLAGGAGFPRAFGDIGARAVIAPLWPVDDAQAHDVAIDLYTAALAPDAPPLAECLRAIRKRAYDTENADTFAAYCFYGDPTARLSAA